MRLALSEMLGPRLSLAGAALMGGQQTLGRWADGAYFAYDATKDKGFLNYGRRLVPLTGLSGISITRATTGYALTQQGQLVSFPSGAARITDRGLLGEGAATNLLLQSQTFQTSWSLTNILAFGSGSTADAATAPDGTTTADLITEGTAAPGENIIFQSVGKAASSITYTFSVYVKRAVGTRNVYLRCDSGSGTNSCSVDFTLSGAGSVGTPQNIGTFSGAAGRITALANDWYRCELQATTGTETGIRVRIYTYNGTTNYNGDGSSGLYLWGAQLETGVATSYVPTTTGSATRNADVISITSVSGLTFPLTLFCEFERIANKNANEMLFYVDAGTGNEQVNLTSLGSGGGTATLRSTCNASGGASQFDLNSANTIAIGSTARLAVRCATNDAKACLNGTLTSGDASVTVPLDPTRIYLGTNNTAGLQPNAYLRRLAIFPSAYTDAQLQALTS